MQPKALIRKADATLLDHASRQLADSPDGGTGGSRLLQGVLFWAILPGTSGAGGSSDNEILAHGGRPGEIEMGEAMPKLFATLALGSLVALSLETTILAGTLDRASDGYVYFHRVGASMKAHDDAVDTCVVDAASMAEPYVPDFVVGGNAPPIDYLAAALAVPPIHGAMQRHIDRRQFLANVENCMVVEGWDVVRLPDAEGREISSLPQPDQAARLAAWVGSREAHNICFVGQRRPTIGRTNHHS